MLVLGRKLNQSIMIGNEIEVAVIDIKGDQVKLGIRAPKSISVYRKELYIEIQEENKKAISSSIKPSDLGKLIDIIQKK